MSALTEATGRGDVILYRTVRNQWGVLWEQSTDGRTYAPVDLTGWAGTVELRSPMGDMWLRAPVVVSANGVTTITITPSTLAYPAWAGRAGGSWVVDLTSPDGHIERLGQGYFHLEA